MRKLWIITVGMVVAGFMMGFGSIAVGLGPIALVCGVLLVWSGIVKVIVPRVWRATLESPPAPERGRVSPLPGTVFSQQR